MSQFGDDSNLSGVDYSKVEGLQRKRILTFVNSFVTNSAQFLVSFTHNCDLKLNQLSVKLTRLEHSLTLLEDKLNSVPILRSIEPQNKTLVEPEVCIESLPLTEEQDEVEEHNENPELVPFLKMLSVGVPEDAVRQKMRLQGLDESQLPSKLFSNLNH